MALLNSIVNGEEASAISTQDRGFNYGDGLFETFLLLNGHAVFWDEHYQRLVNGCGALGIASPTEQRLKNDIDILYQLNPNVRTAVIKLMVTRGDSERGYHAEDNLSPNIITSISTYPSYLTEYWNEGVLVKKCNTLLSSQIQLAGLKHLNRLEQVLARQEWRDEFQEGLMSDVNGNIVEGVMSNIFIVKNETMSTPLIKNAGVNGVMRNIVLKLCEANGIMVVEDNLSNNKLVEADEIFLTNSIIGIWPVKRLENKSYPNKLTTKIMKLLVEKYSVDYATLYL